MATGNAIQSAVSASGGLSNPVTIAQGGTGQTSASASFIALSPLTTAGDLIIENATPAPARLAVGSANQVLGVSGGVPAWQLGFTLQQTTGLTGYALVNGTGNIVTWTAPNDGNMHRVFVLVEQHVTNTETGGAIGLATTAPDNTSHTFTPTGFSGGSGVSYASFAQSALVYPGTAVTLEQTSALTGGACVLWAEIWGS